MKRLKLIVIIVFMLSLTGCIQKYTATDEQTDAVAEYMAGKLVESDKDYNQELISEDELTGDITNDGIVTQAPSLTSTPNDTPSATPGNNQGESSGTYTLSEVLGNENFDINYKSYELVDTYSGDKDDAFFVINHRQGYQLLVVFLSISNKTSSKQVFKHTTNHTKEFQLDINSGILYSPLPLSLQENDLQDIELEVGAGKTENGLLFFEVLEDDEMSSIKLSVTMDGKLATVKLK